MLLLAASALMVLGCRGTQHRSTGGVLDDRVLGQRVKAALDNQPVYKYPDVKVNAEGGVVQLRGIVAAPEQKEAATEIAERVRGVAGVQNHIAIVPSERTAVRDIVPDGSDDARAGGTNARSRATGAPSRDSGTNSGSKRVP